jgi:3-oxoacyl-(acyl-carrier-protein) synthase
MERKRVVITGFGVISNLGSDIKTFWDNLIQGYSGIRKITQFDASNLPCQIAGEIDDFRARRLHRTEGGSAGSHVLHRLHWPQRRRRSGMQSLPDVKFDPERAASLFRNGNRRSG